MKIWLPVVLVVSLLAAACGGGEGESSADGSENDASASDGLGSDAPALDDSGGDDAGADGGNGDPASLPSEVFSDDGEVGVRVGAADADVDVSIRVLDPSEWPEAVAGGENVPGVTIYELEPDGAVFEEPVMVTRRIDLDRFTDLGLGPDDVPMLTMVTQNDAGDFELMDDLSLLRVGDSLFVTATTMHFSPVIISNENTRLPFDVDRIVAAEVIAGQNTADALAMADGLRGIVGSELGSDSVISTATLRRAVEGIDVRPSAAVSGDDEALFVPPEWAVGGLQFDPVRRDAPVDYPGADMALRAGRVGSTFTGLPLSWAPSASTLLGDPDVEFAMTVAVLELFVDDDVLDDAIDEVIDDALDSWEFPDEVSFVYEIFHRIYGVYPSSVVKRYRGLQLPDGLVGYTTTWEGEVGPGGRLVSIGELTADGGDLVGEAGIECFCEYLEALLVVAGGFDAATLESLPGNGTIEFLAEGVSDDDEALEIALALLTNPTDNEDFELIVEQRFIVREDEGVIFDETSSFTELLAVIP